MKKFSMGMMLTGLLVMQVGCGEEAAPVDTPVPDGGAMHSAPAGHDAVTPGTDTTTPGTDATTPDADATTPGADADKEVVP